MTQAETASWCGYDGPDAVEQLNAEHDPLHADLCRWLGIKSFSLRIASGERLNMRDATLAAYEEAAVLALQRFRQMARRAGVMR